MKPDPHRWDESKAVANLLEPSNIVLSCFDSAVLARSARGHLAHGDRLAVVAHGEGVPVGGADDLAVVAGTAGRGVCPAIAAGLRGGRRRDDRSGRS